MAGVHDVSKTNDRRFPANIDILYIRSKQKMCKTELAGCKGGVVRCNDLAGRSKGGVARFKNRAIKE